MTDSTSDPRCGVTGSEAPTGLRPASPCIAIILVKIRFGDIRGYTEHDQLALCVDARLDPVESV